MISGLTDAQRRELEALESNFRVYGYLPTGEVVRREAGDTYDEARRVIAEVRAEGWSNLQVWSLVSGMGHCMNHRLLREEAPPKTTSQEHLEDRCSGEWEYGCWRARCDACDGGQLPRSTNQEVNDGQSGCAMSPL